MNSGFGFTEIHWKVGFGLSSNLH